MAPRSIATRVVVGAVAPAFIACGALDVDFVGLLTVVGLPVLCVVDATGLPLVVGLPVLRVVDATGLPLVAGFPDVGGLLGDAAPCASANAGDSIRDVAATKPRIVAETRIRVPPLGGSARGMPRRRMQFG